MSGLLLAMGGRLLAADANMIVVLKGQRHEQTGPTLAMLREEDDESGDGPLALEAFAVGGTADSLVSGTLQIPGGVIFQLLHEEGDTRLWHEYQTDAILDLDTVRSNGTYTFSLSTQNDGVRQVVLELLGNVYPSVPVVTNYVALQAINATNDTLVYWTPMSGGTTNDFILFSVYDTQTDEIVFESERVGPGALDGLALQATIPGNTLEPGRTYEAEVLFVKVVDVNTNDYPEVYAFAGYSQQTELEIRTTPQSGVSLNAQFEYAIPSPGAGDVPRDSAISFHFSQPMNPGALSINWTGLNPANLSYQWLEENRVLLCRYSDNLPSDAEIGWMLDLTGFRDAANFPLEGEAEGWLYTSSDEPESPPDVSWVSLLKAREYQQTGATPVSTGMYGCEISVEPSAYNRVKSASVLAGATGCSQLLEAEAWDVEMELDAVYATKSDLDRFFANGEFTFELETLADGFQDMTLDLGTSDDYPAAPTVSNLAALQAIDPDAPLTLQWTAPDNWTNTLLAGHTVILFGIENDQGNEIYWVDPDAFASGSQGVIPANTLWPGRSYRACVTFIKIKDVETDGYEGATGVAGFSSVTSFTLTTTGDVIMPAVQITPENGNMKLRVSGGEPQRGYVGEASTDLIRWLPLTDLWLGEVAQNVEWYDNDAHYLKKRFYRLRDRLPEERAQPHITIQGVVTAGSTPVPGAIVGTDLDGQTTVTDESGSFFLETDTPGNYGWAEYTITVTSGATHKDFGPWYWGDQPREQSFELN